LATPIAVAETDCTPGEFRAHLAHDLAQQVMRGVEFERRSGINVIHVSPSMR
jgi:hypothetical protein